MKNILLIGLLLIFSVSGFSQEKAEPKKEGVKKNKKEVQQFLVVNETVKKELKPVTLSRYITGGNEVLFVNGNGVGSVIKVGNGLNKSIKKYEELLKSFKEAQGEKNEITEVLGTEKLIDSYVYFGKSDKRVYMKSTIVTYAFMNGGKVKNDPVFMIMISDMKGRDNKFVIQKPRTLFMFEKDVIKLKNLKIKNLDKKEEKK